MIVILNISVIASHLLQMRGLKPQGAKKNPCPSRRIFYRCVDWNNMKSWLRLLKPVASFTDAWIETDFCRFGKIYETVASFTDAWIETCTVGNDTVILWSHLLQMRGLKQNHSGTALPSWSRIFYRCVDWNLKRQCPKEVSEKSHLLQMRGLKLAIGE